MPSISGSVKDQPTEDLIWGSVDVIIRFLSTGIKGKIVGFEPVAIIIFFAANTSELPSSLVTFTDLAESKDPKP